MAIVLITVFVMGGATEFALKVFKIDTGVDEHTYMRETLLEPIVPSTLMNFGMLTRNLSKHNFPSTQIFLKLTLSPFVTVRTPSYLSFGSPRLQSERRNEERIFC